jgi:GT2 family glycosyltransferase
VLHHCDPRLLDVVLASLDRQTYRDFETVVIDDASQDGSAEHLRRRWPDVRAVRTGESAVGVSAALNFAVAAARCEYVALLNNDLELDPDWLGLLVETLDRHPEACSASGKLLNFHRREIFDGAGDILRWSGAATHRGFQERDVGQYDRPEAIFAPCAGAALVRRSAFEDVGLFDEDFFAYQEDVDWGLRAQLLGLASRYEPRAIAYHMGSATTGRQPGRYALLQRRNQLLVVIKNYPLVALVRHCPKVVVGQVGQLLDGWRQGAWRLQPTAWRQVLARLPETLRKRWAVQRSRRVSAAQLGAIMAPERYAELGLRERLGLLVQLVRSGGSG